MKDILGREVKDYDLVVGKGSGRHVYGMSIGVWYGKSMATLDSGKRSMSDIYLIENPTEKELEIKTQIVKKLKEAERTAEEKRKIKCIPFRELQRGGIYEDTQGCAWLYFGEANVTLLSMEPYSWRLHWKLAWERQGRCFIEADPKFLESKNVCDLGWLGRIPNVEILKGNKKLVKLIDKADIENELVFKSEADVCQSAEQLTLAVKE